MQIGWGISASGCELVGSSTRLQVRFRTMPRVSHSKNDSYLGQVHGDGKAGDQTMQAHLKPACYLSYDICCIISVYYLLRGICLTFH